MKNGSFCLQWWYINPHNIYQPTSKNGWPRTSQKFSLGRIPPSRTSRIKALIKASASSGLNVSCSNVIVESWDPLVCWGWPIKKVAQKHKKTGSERKDLNGNDLKNVVFLFNWWKGGRRGDRLPFFLKVFVDHPTVGDPKKSTATSIRNSRRHNASKVGKRWAWSTSSWWVDDGKMWRKQKYHAKWWVFSKLGPVFLLESFFLTDFWWRWMEVIEDHWSPFYCSKSVPNSCISKIRSSSSKPFKWR